MSDTIWVTLHGSDYSGWMRKGSWPASSLPGHDFWGMALRVACKAEGGFVDAAQCYDSAIMTAGPMQCTARFGTLQKILAAQPDELLRKYLASAFSASGLALRHAPPSFMNGLDPCGDEPGLRKAILGGSNGRVWTEEQKQLAFQWVDGLGRLFADSSALPYVAKTSAAELRSYIGPEAQVILDFSRGEPPPIQNAREAAACFVAFSINNPKGALALLRQTGPDASAMLLAASKPGSWPSTFATRVGRTTGALSAEDWR